MNKKLTKQDINKEILGLFMPEAVETPRIPKLLQFLRQQKAIIPPTNSNEVKI